MGSVKGCVMECRAREVREVSGQGFSCIVQQCKSLHPAINQFLACSTKLHTAVVNTVTALANSLEALQSVAAVAADSAGHCRDVSDCLKSLHTAHRQLGIDLGSVERVFERQFIDPLQLRNDSFRKQVAKLQKKHTRE